MHLNLNDLVFCGENFFVNTPKIKENPADSLKKIAVAQIILQDEINQAK